MIIKYHLINKGTSRQCCPAPELVFGSSPSNDAGPSDDLRAIEVTEVKLIKHGCLAGWQAKKIQRFGRHESKICYICCMDFILFLHRHCKGTLNYPKQNHPIFFGVITSLENTETQAPRPRPTTAENCT